MERKGSSEAIFEIDNERRYFLEVLPVHPEMKMRGQDGGHAKGQVEGQAGGRAIEISLHGTEKAILGIL